MAPPPEINDIDLNDLWMAIRTTETSKVSKQKKKNAETMMDALQQFLTSPRAQHDQSLSPFTGDQIIVLRILYNAIDELMQSTSESEAQARMALATAVEKVLSTLEPAMSSDVVKEICGSLRGEHTSGNQKQQSHLA